MRFHAAARYRRPGRSGPKRPLAVSGRRAPPSRPPLRATLEELIAATAPITLAVFGAGTDTVGQLLVTAGDNPERLRSEAALARLLGIAPIPASSGTHCRRTHQAHDHPMSEAVRRPRDLPRPHHDFTTINSAQIAA